MAPTGGAQGGGDQGAGGVGAARRSRERTRRERLAGWRRQRKETKRRSLVGKGGETLNPSFSGRGETFLLSSLREKGKVRIVVDFVFSIVDQLLTRSLGLE